MKCFEKIDGDRDHDGQVDGRGDGDGDADGDKSVDGDSEHDSDSEVLPQQLWLPMCPFVQVPAFSKEQGLPRETSPQAGEII